MFEKRTQVPLLVEPIEGFLGQNLAELLKYSPFMVSESNIWWSLIKIAKIVVEFLEIPEVVLLDVVALVLLKVVVDVQLVVGVLEALSCQILVSTVYVDVPLERLACRGLELKIFVYPGEHALQRDCALRLGVVLGFRCVEFLHHACCGVVYVEEMFVLNYGECVNQGLEAATHHLVEHRALSIAK